MERVRITDVSPRDGLQNEPGAIPTSDKVELIRLLCETGVDEVEVTSFVSPKWVPQLADAGEVCAKVGRMIATRPSLRPSRISVLIPNVKGLEAAERVNREVVHFEAMAHAELPRGLIDKIAFFTAASETFSLRNTNASIAETLRRFQDVIRSGIPGHWQVRAYVSCAVACPFEGPIAPARVADLCASIVDLGIAGEIDLGDTIGAGTPETITSMLLAVKGRLGEGWFERNAITLHLHDTFGRAAECVKAALEAGVRSFDGSVAGLGGCPYASTPGRRAPGNISTELLVRTVHGQGFATGVDLVKLEAAAEFAQRIVAISRAT